MIPHGWMQFRVILRMEARGVLRDPLNIKLLLVLPGVIAFALWPYTLSPLLPALAGAFLIAEPRLANFLFTSPHEGEALQLLPRSWMHVVAAKNVSAAGVVICAFLLLAVPANYFSPAPATAGEWGVALCGLGATLFPLFHIANRHAIEHPRRRWSWSVGDLAEAILFLVSVGIGAIPFCIFALFGEPIIGSLLFIPVAAFLWLRVTLPRTARALGDATFLEGVEE